VNYSTLPISLFILRPPSIEKGETRSVAKTGELRIMHKIAAWKPVGKFELHISLIQLYGVLGCPAVPLRIDATQSVFLIVSSKDRVDYACAELSYLCATQIEVLGGKRILI
jgi:hypothetical protein